MKIATQGIVAALVLLGLPATAIAQSNRTFVSGSGVDSGMCSISAPCRSFAYAVTQTAANGELVVKDGAGYGPVTITQSITIANDGVGTASISVPSNGTGIEINAGANDTVQIRGIEIDGNGVGANGIKVDAAGSVQVLSVIARHFKYNAVGINATGVKMSISNTIASDSGVGIYLAYTASASMTIDNSKADSNQDGINTCGAGTVAITRTSASFNSQNGIVAGSQCKTTIILRDSVVTSNQYGIQEDSGNALVSHSIVAGNSVFGLWQAGGQLVTYGDNNINFNGQDVKGTITKYTTE